MHALSLATAASILQIPQAGLGRLWWHSQSSGARGRGLGMLQYATVEKTIVKAHYESNIFKVEESITCEVWERNLHRSDPSSLHNSFVG